jgi:hypothetical protein
MRFEIIIYLKENKLLFIDETSFSHSIVDKNIRTLRKNMEMEKGMLFWHKIQ